MQTLRNSPLWTPSATNHSTSMNAERHQSQHLYERRAPPITAEHFGALWLVNVNIGDFLKVVAQQLNFFTDFFFIRDNLCKFKLKLWSAKFLLQISTRNALLTNY